MAYNPLKEAREDVATKPSFMDIREGVSVLGEGVLPRKKKNKKSKSKRKTKKKDCGCK